MARSAAAKPPAFQQCLDGVASLCANLHGHSFPAHSHTEFVFGINESGRHRAVRGSWSAVLGVGDIAIVAPDEIHSAASIGEEPWTWRAFYIEPQTLQQLIGSEGRTLPPAVSDPGLSSALLAAHRAFAAAEPAMGKALLEEVLAALFALYGTPSERTAPVSSRVRRTQALLEARRDGRLPLDELSRLVGCTPHHLIREFRRHVGLTPGDYLVQLRVRRAQQLLREGWSTSEAAAELGFADQSHLTRQFKRQLGMTPNVYRRAVTGDGRKRDAVRDVQGDKEGEA